MWAKLKSSNVISFNGFSRNKNNFRRVVKETMNAERRAARFNNLPLSASFKYGSLFVGPPGAASLICKHKIETERVRKQGQTSVHFKPQV